MSFQRLVSDRQTDVRTAATRPRGAWATEKWTVHAHCAIWRHWWLSSEEPNVEETPRTVTDKQSVSCTTEFNPTSKHDGQTLWAVSMSDTLSVDTSCLVPLDRRQCVQLASRTNYTHAHARAASTRHVTTAADAGRTSARRASRIYVWLMQCWHRSRT